MNQRELAVSMIQRETRKPNPRKGLGVRCEKTVVNQPVTDTMRQDAAKYLKNERDTRQVYVSRISMTLKLISFQRVSASKSLQELCPKCAYCNGGNLALVRWIAEGVPVQVSRFGRELTEMQNQFHAHFLCDRHLNRLREYSRTRRTFEYPEWYQVTGLGKQ